ncbi:unnamed protein product, partial [Ectocarpus sp. 8 AP-2014]
MLSALAPFLVARDTTSRSPPPSAAAGVFRPGAWTAGRPLVVRPGAEGAAPKGSRVGAAADDDGVLTENNARNDPITHTQASTPRANRHPTAVPPRRPPPALL